MTTARDIMHSGVRCIPATETLDRAAQLMRELNVGALPVCDSNDRMTGMVTDRDIVIKCVARGHDPAKVTAGDLAEGTPRWIAADADIAEALAAMKMHQIRRLPVVANKKLVGMISEADIARHLSEQDVHAFAERVYAATLRDRRSRYTVSRVLPTVSRRSIAACASAARSSGNVWPVTGRRRPAAASVRAAMVSSVICWGETPTPRTRLTPRRAASASSIAANEPLAAP
jgi:CBS domain-containing protein